MSDARAFAPPIPVLGASAVNGLGTSLHQVWAFRRAEVSGLVETPLFLPDGSHPPMVAMRFLEPNDVGVHRLAAILGALLGPWTRALAGRVGHGRLHVSVALAERLADEAQREEADFLLRRLQAVVAEADPGVQLEWHPYGHGGGAYAAMVAGDRLVSGAADVAFVVGLDTYYDPDVVQALGRAGVLFGGSRPRGRVPGEGGALVVLARGDFARQLGWPARAHLAAAGVASASGVAAELGAGLTTAVRATVDALAESRETVDWWIGDATGESARVRELSVALPRFTARVGHPASRVEMLPAELGDLGAATLPTAMALAVESFSRGDPLARHFVAWAASDGPTRGAVRLGHELGGPDGG